MPILRLYGAVRVIEVPSISMLPLVTLSKPASIIKTVVLPDPDGPKRVMNSLFLTSRLKSLTTRVFWS